MSEDFILKMNGICKRFPGVLALDHVDFQVKAGEVHCLIGANGAGKSTLIKILAGVYPQDEGSIWFDGKELTDHGTLARRRAGISVIYQELSLFNDLTVGENIFVNNYPVKSQKIDWAEVYKRSAELVRDMHIDINVHDKVSELSIGQRQLVELMKSLACNSKLIVMDEPSATLSQDEFETLLRVIKNLKEKGITIIYISHRLEELFLVGDSITILRDGKKVTSLPAKDLNEDKLVEYMIGYSLKKGERSVTSNCQPSEVILEVNDLSNDKLKNINLQLHKGEIFGMYGLVGSGRTEVLRAIYGVDRYQSGNIRVRGKVAHYKSPHEAIRDGIGLLPENRKTQGLVTIRPVWENIVMLSFKKFMRNGFIHYGPLNRGCNEFVKNLNIKTPSICTTTYSLSGGNQQKVVLAKWLMRNCDILLIDEPTQGIDVGAKSEIYKIIRKMSEEGKCVIIASSELDEIMQVCDRIAVLYEGQLIHVYDNEKLDQDAVMQTAVSGKLKA